MAPNSVGEVFRTYEAELRRRQAAVEQQHMLARAYNDQPLSKFLAPMPPPPVSGSHKRNKRLLLCHP